ncbi:MAG: dienelactone hydrolase family protein [Gammaproteobacteria bacterium]|nr:dienelactone hydrolase family protein [Gammaproteobacteria bacterium]
MKTGTALLLLTLMPVTQAFAAERYQEQTLTTVNKEHFIIYTAGPRNAKAGIVLVHDWFGVSPFYLEYVHRLAKLNARVVAVDLYDGERATTHQDAWGLLSAMDAATAARKIDAALEALERDGRELAIMGFSMGVEHALSAAVRHGEKISAAVTFYGATLTDQQKLAGLGGPVLAVFGSRDGDAADQAAAFSKAADEAGAAVETYVYPGAHHAFAQPLFNQGETYDPVAAQAAENLAVDFLRRTVLAEP